MASNGSITTSQHSYDAKRYYHRRIELGMSAFDANRRRSKETYRTGQNQRMRTYRQRWGYPYRNFLDQMLRELGKTLGLSNREEVKSYIRENGVSGKEFQCLT